MSNFRKERLTLDEVMRSVGAEWTGEPHIAFDPNLKHQYRIIRQQSHDGTQIFTCQMMEDALMNLFRRNSYYAPMGLPAEDVDIFYTVGPIRLVTVHGKVNLPAGRYPGQRERITIPVRCEYRKRVAPCHP
jgi:hypothetical protein